MELSLEFEDNGTGHNDLVLRFAGGEWKCDSYYLAIDPEFPDKEGVEKVRSVLRLLLEQWITSVNQQLDEGAIYLPFDFLDQGTGWLKCERSGNEVTVSLGWATVEGWSFCPSNVREMLNRCPSGFRVDGPTINCNSSELIDAIRRSLTQ